MKINQKIYSQITTQPFDVQELENGVTVELHSLNSNEALFNEYGPKAKFSIWTCSDSKNYRLLLEDGYYLKMRELFGKRCNQCWINFWDDVEVRRKKIMLQIFLPLAIVVLAIMSVCFALQAQIAQLWGENGQMILLAISLGVFIVGNVIINKRIDKVINESNAKAVEDIKNIVGHKHFDELMEVQKVYYNEFFGIEEEPAESEQPVTEEETTEVTEEPAEGEIETESK